MNTKEEQCQECKRMMPNVGNWRESTGVRRLCGGCKVRITLANPRIREGLEREFTAVLSHIVSEDEVPR